MLFGSVVELVGEPRHHSIKRRLILGDSLELVSKLGGGLLELLDLLVLLQYCRSEIVNLFYSILKLLFSIGGFKSTDNVLCLRQSFVNLFVWFNC